MQYIAVILSLCLGSQLENVSSLYTQGLTEENLEILPAQAQGLPEREPTAQLPQSCALAELLSYGT